MLSSDIQAREYLSTGEWELKSTWNKMFFGGVGDDRQNDDDSEHMQFDIFVRVSCEEVMVIRDIYVRNRVLLRLFL